jgi:carbonic anhydrase/acetyltransferase-like protein (isoleucine patch superfamily)
MGNVDNKENKKYELSENSRDINGVTVYQIRALKTMDFVNSIGDTITVEPGDLGGYVQSEDNLSQSGNCWVFDNAVVMNESTLSGNAVAMDSATVCEQARLSDNAKAVGNCQISGDASLRNHAMANGKAIVTGNAILRDYSIAGGESIVTDHAELAEYAITDGSAYILDSAKIAGYTIVRDHLTIRGSITITFQPNRTIFEGDIEVNNARTIRSIKDFDFVVGLSVTYYKERNNESNIYVITKEKKMTIEEVKEIAKQAKAEVDARLAEAKEKAKAKEKTESR